MTDQFWWGVATGSVATWSAAVTTLVIAAALMKRGKK